MIAQDIYERLASHLSTLVMALPYREELVDILKEMFTPIEAQVALALPSKVIPLQAVGVDDIIDNVSLPRQELLEILEDLAGRGLIYSGKTKKGEKGYALLQRGFGFPQVFHWKGEKTPYAAKMAEMIEKYHKTKVLDEVYGTTKTKEYRYIPVHEAIEGTPQGVYDYDMMENVIKRASNIAVAHCPCRMTTQLLGKGCNHLLEVCLKFDDMAEFIIGSGFGRKVTKEEALEIVKKAEEDGLVHFVDNVQGDVKHNCNCCGCCCWNLGRISRRQMPRDIIISTYFISEVDEDTCMGCSDCIEICPANALTIDGTLAIVDKNWCIGCGLCRTRCQLGAIKLVRRTDLDEVPLPSFKELHETIRNEIMPE